MLFSSANTIVMWLPSVLERIRMGDWVARGIGNGILRLSPPGQPPEQIQPGSAAVGSLHSPQAAQVGSCQWGWCRSVVRTTIALNPRFFTTRLHTLPHCTHPHSSRQVIPGPASLPFCFVSLCLPPAQHPERCCLQRAVLPRLSLFQAFRKQAGLVTRTKPLICLGFDYTKVRSISQKLPDRSFI